VISHPCRAFRNRRRCDWFGTDLRDAMNSSATCNGARVSLLVGGRNGAVVTIGVLYRRRLPVSRGFGDSLMMRFVDAMLSFRRSSCCSSFRR